MKNYSLGIRLTVVGLATIIAFADNTSVFAAQNTDDMLQKVVVEENNKFTDGNITSGYYINDIYKDIYTEEDIRRLTEDDIPALKMMNREDVPYFDNFEGVVTYAKEQMLNRVTTINYSIPDSIETANFWYDVDRAVKNEESSVSYKDGDYLNANAIGWTYYTENDYENETVTYHINYVYTSTAEQEAEVDAMIPQVLESLGLHEKTDYEKIKAIHDYICNRVNYDEDAWEYYLETGKSEPVVHSTYAALIEGKSVCQGYASLFFRLSKEVGLFSRYIGGYCIGAPHAWNIVCLEDEWYNMDLTFNDGDGYFSYTNFLQSEESFSLRELDSEYITEEFISTHPMAQEDYEAFTIKAFENDNLTATFHTIDGTEVSVTATDTPKILYFYDEDNGRSVKQLKDISACDWIGNYEFIAVDSKENDKHAVNTFSDTYGLNNLTFCYDESEDTLNTMKSYCEMASIEYSEFFPYIVMIDSENKVRQVVSGYYTVEELKTALDKLKKTEQIPTNPVEPEKPEEPKPVEPVEPIEPVEPENPQPTPTDHPFTDVPTSGWKAESVSYVYHNAIMNGISGTTLFEPDNTLTRGMFATILYRIAGSPAVTYEARFTDVPDGKWFSNAIIWAADEGIVNGFGDGTYGVNTDITREQVIKMIGVFASKMGNSVSSSNDLSSFEDMDSVSLWARGYVGWAVDNGIISGRPTENGGYRVDPKGTATRAECAKMVSKYLDAYK